MRGVLLAVDASNEYSFVVARRKRHGGFGEGMGWKGVLVCMCMTEGWGMGGDY